MDTNEKVKFFDYKGVKMLLLDFSNCTAYTLPDIISLAKETISKQPEHSLFVLSDFTNAHYDSLGVQALKDLVSHNKPFIKASAVIGVDRLKKIIFDVILTFLRKDLRLFNSALEAKDWLAEEAKKEK